MKRKRDEDRDLRQAVMRACKAVEKSLGQEPSAIIVSGLETEEPDNIDGVTSWLFHRRQDNDRTGN